MSPYSRRHAAKKRSGYPPSAAPLVDFAGRAVLVTGGAGRIGRALSEAFARAGAKVASLRAIPRVISST